MIYELLVIKLFFHFSHDDQSPASRSALSLSSRATFSSGDRPKPVNWESDSLQLSKAESSLDLGLDDVPGLLRLPSRGVVDDITRCRRTEGETKGNTVSCEPKADESITNEQASQLLSRIPDRKLPKFLSITRGVYLCMFMSP